MLEKFKTFEFLKNDIQKLENYLLSFSDSLEGILKETVKNTLIAGGKRIRPALFLICARNKSYDIDWLLPAAASIEIIHTASLIHDDIIDKSFLRRGRKTIHNIYDRDTAKFVGNYLFTHTFCLLNSYKNSKVLEEMSKTAQNLVRGEFDQIKTKKNFSQSEHTYFDKVEEKTSSLFKASCALGGILSDSASEDIKNMRKFGSYLGTSFQINDDIIDVDLRNYHKRIGKHKGNDIRQGNITLPLIYALKNREFRMKVKPILDKKNIDASDVEKILFFLDKTDSINITHRKFNYYLGIAKKVINKIHGKERREGLTKICDYFMEEGKKFN